jgi:hypothetical protein
MYVHIVGMADIYIQTQIVRLLFQIATGILSYIERRHSKIRVFKDKKNRHPGG